MSDENKKREVGYGKPPEHTRFAKGKSGNPRGRPKGSQNFATILAKTTQERIDVTLNDKVRRITKAKAIALQLTNQAVSGDLRAIRDCTDMQIRFEESKSADLPAPVLHEHDTLTIASIVQRIQRAKAEQPVETSSVSASTEPSGSKEQK